MPSGGARSALAQVIHRDLKTANILLTGRDCEIVKIGDFGISRLMVRRGPGETCVGGVTKEGVGEGGVAKEGVGEGAVAKEGVAEGGVAKEGVGEGGVAKEGVGEGGVAKEGVWRRRA